MSAFVRLLSLWACVCVIGSVQAGKLRRNQFSVYNVNVHAAATDGSYNRSTSTLLRAQCKAVCMRKMVEFDASLSEAQKGVALASEKLMETCLAMQTCAACERGCNAPLMRDQAEREREPVAPIVCPLQCKILPENLVKSCTDSCRMLNELIDERRRYDPVTDAIGQNETARKCIVNFDCPSSQRCCHRQCGMCEQLVPFPTILDVTERENVDAVPSSDKQIGFDIEWTVPDNLPVDGPIVYVVDVRSHFGVTFDEERAAAWNTVLMTTSKGAYLRGVRLGELYRFRLAAVSPDGTQGYSAPTQPKRSSQEPRAPSPPDNLHEENRIVKPNGLIDIQFGWEPPVQTDVEVTKYKLFWFQKSDMSNGRVRASRETKKTVAAPQLSFIVEDLNAEMVYCFAVQAICDYNDKKLRSQRAVVCVNTSALAGHSDHEATTSSFSLTTRGYDEDSEEAEMTQDYADWDADSDNEMPNASDEYDDATQSTVEATSMIGNTETISKEFIASPSAASSSSSTFYVLQALFGGAFYENDELRAAISWTYTTNSRNPPRATPKFTVVWRPLMCSDVQGDNIRPQNTVSLVTEAQQAVIGGLRFGCQYQIAVRLLATSNTAGNETALTFVTPRCSEVSVKDGRGPLCPTTPSPKIQSTVSPPKNVQVRLIESWTKQSWTKYYHAYVNWTTILSAHGYRVVYGRKSAQSTPTAPKMEKGGAITKVITTSYTSLLDLEADTTYVLQLQALSDSGDSRIVQVHFTTADSTPEQTQVEAVKRPGRRKATNGAATVRMQLSSAVSILTISNLVWLCLQKWL